MLRERRPPPVDRMWVPYMEVGIGIQRQGMG